MDDIEVFGDSIYHLDRKVGEIKRLARLIGLSFNDSKSGVVTEAEAEALQKTKTLKTFPIVGRGSAKTYKYLGFEQYWVNGSTTKETVLAEAYRRVRRIAKSNLTIINIGRMYRVYVSPLVRFVSQSMDWKQSELMKLTTFARVMLKKMGRIPTNFPMKKCMHRKRKEDWDYPTS